MIVKSTQRQGMRGPRPLMVSCGAPQHLAVSGRRGKSAVWMWLTGQCGSTVGRWSASPAEGCPGPRRGLGIGRRRRPGIGMVGGRAVWAAQVVTFDMSGLVWCKPGSWRAFRDAQVAVGGLAGSGGCHRVVTSGAKHGGTQGDTLRRFVRISGRGGTGWDG